MVDGARIASPGLISLALTAARMSDDPVVSTLGWHLGPDLQARSVADGYSREVEDSLLNSIGWPKADGYRLFEVSALAGSSKPGWFAPIAESNALFLRRSTFDSIGGFDERFTSPGGGLVNLDFFDRVHRRPGVESFVLLGEGTFHQLHGGVTTGGGASPPLSFKDLEPEYKSLRGHSWSTPHLDSTLVGKVPDTAVPFIRESLKFLEPSAPPLEGTRGLSNQAATNLNPGSEHYRAYVGPPERYDSMGASQFRLLTALGLRAHHRLLDFGCGSLRAGRLFIPYLDEGNYYGLEPNRWLIEDAVERELGKNLLEIKRPNLLHHDSFTIDEFGTDFDFIVAQSILSHTAPDLTVEVTKNILKGLAPGGLAAVTFLQVDDEVQLGEDRGKGWVYPATVPYRRREVLGFIKDYAAVELNWEHPRQTWYLLANSMSELPTKDFTDSLVGKSWTIRPKTTQ